MCDKTMSIWKTLNLLNLHALKIDKKKGKTNKKKTMKNIVEKGKKNSISLNICEKHKISRNYPCDIY